MATKKLPTAKKASTKSVKKPAPRKTPEKAALTTARNALIKHYVDGIAAIQKDLTAHIKNEKERLAIARKALARIRAGKTTI